MELRSDISKKDLADALILLLKKKEYARISIQDIVDRAGLSRMAYYRNFESKDAILRFYISRITDDFIRESHVNYDVLPLDEYIVVLFTHLKRWAAFCQLLQQNGLLYFVEDEFNLIFAGKASGRDEQYQYGFIAGGLFNIFSLWLKQGCRETPEELAQMFKGFMK